MINDDKIVFLKPVTIKARRLELEKEHAANKAEFIEKNTEINFKISLLQKRCSHENTTYSPDPSGNNDSSLSCNDCGKEI
jgi:hypothetical protein